MPCSSTRFFAVFSPSQGSPRPLLLLSLSHTLTRSRHCIHRSAASQPPSLQDLEPVHRQQANRRHYLPVSVPLQHHPRSCNWALPTAPSPPNTPQPSPRFPRVKRSHWQTVLHQPVFPFLFSSAFLSPITRKSVSDSFLRGSSRGLISQFRLFSFSGARYAHESTPYPPADHGGSRSNADRPSQAVSRECALSLLLPRHPRHHLEPLLTLTFPLPLSSLAPPYAREYTAV
jgi:hypothetical protein